MAHAEEALGCIEALFAPPELAASELRLACAALAALGAQVLYYEHKLAR